MKSRRKNARFFRRQGNRSMSDLGNLSRRKVGAVPAITDRPRSEPAPRSDDDFMTGIQIALDLTPKELAKALGMARAELVDRHGPRAAMSNWVVDPFWEILLRYVNDRLAGFMVVKEALERKQ